MFYAAAARICKVRFELLKLCVIFRVSVCVLVLYSLRRGRALRSDPGPMTRGWLSRKYPAYLGTERCFSERHFQTKTLHAPDVVALQTFGTDSVEVVAT